MQNSLSVKEKQSIVAEYANGMNVSELCSLHGVPRSTLYNWIRRFSALSVTDDQKVLYQEYLNLKRHSEKLKMQIEIIRATECGSAAPLKEKLNALEKLHGQYDVTTLCEALEVSRGTFYNHIFRRKDVTQYDKHREEIREHVKNVFEESGQRYGARKIAGVLANRGVHTSPKYVSDLMHDMGLESVVPNAKKAYKKRIKLEKRSNVLQRQFNATAPNLVWVSDVTCFKIHNRFYYICVIIDLFSRKIVAYKVSPKNSTYLITTTFRKAYASRNPGSDLIFHSDQGSQYTANTFRKLLQMNNIVQSFSRPGCPQDNAVSEAFFSVMKREELYHTNLKSEREFRICVDNYMLKYNTERAHETLGYKSPDQFEMMYGSKKN